MTLRHASRHWLVPMCLVVLLGGLVLPTPAVHAATTYTVNVLTDTGAGAGTTGDLRYALNQVLAHSGGDTITITATGTITLGSALPTLTQSMTINGPGANLLTISGNHAVQVFHVVTNRNELTSINNLTIANGASDEGGGIYAGGAGTLAVTNSSFTGNTAGAGGAIYNAVTCPFGCNSTVTVTNSTVSGNSAKFGGGIENNGGTVTVTNSTLSDNSAPGNSAPDGSGGGIDNNDGTLTVTNSTLSGNSAPGSSGGGIFVLVGTVTVTNSTLTGNSATGGGGGGGIENYYGTVTVTNSTLTGNSATRGGGIYNEGPMTLTNTIVAGNTTTGTGPDLGGLITSGGHNLIGTIDGTTGITTGTNGDLVNPTPRLGPLGSNGGPTQTISLLPGSPAIDAGDDAICASTTTPAGAAVSGKDQRGFSRPQGTHCDIGAFEVAVVNALPGAKPPGPAGGPPSALPTVRPPGTTGGPAPNPVPASRP